MWALLAVMLAALGCSFFFSSSETAFFSLKEEQVLRLKEMHPMVGERVVSLLSDRSHLLTVVLFGNMLVNVAYASVSVIVSMLVGGGGVRSATVEAGALLVLILFGEVFPKYLALAMPERIAGLFAVPLGVAGNVLGPLAGWLGGLAAVDVGEDVDELTDEDLDMLVRLVGEQGEISFVEERMIRGILHLKRIRVSRIMTPRPEVVAIPIGASIEEALALARRYRFSKIPVYRETLDDVIGVLHTKDLLLKNAQRLEHLVRTPPLVVPEGASIGALLKTFREERRNFAIVVDEYGGLAGVVSLEDVMEELIGEISDKYDTERPMVEKVSASVYRVSGRMPLHEWSETFGVDVDLDDVDTVGGLVVAFLDRTPRPGDVVDVDGIRLRVEDVRHHRVVNLLVEDRR